MLLDWATVCSQLLRYMSCIGSSCIGRRQAINLLTIYPNGLLSTSSDTLSWHLEELCEAFGDKAVSMIVK